MKYGIRELCTPETRCRIEVTTYDEGRSELYMSLGGIGCGRATNPDKPNQVRHNLGAGYGYSEVRQAVTAFHEAHEIVDRAAIDAQGNVYFVDPTSTAEEAPSVLSADYDNLVRTRNMVLGNTPLHDGQDRDMVISAFAQGVSPEQLFANQSTIAG